MTLLSHLMLKLMKKMRNICLGGSGNFGVCTSYRNTGYSWDHRLYVVDQCLSITLCMYQRRCPCWWGLKLKQQREMCHTAFTTSFQKYNKILVYMWNYTHWNIFQAGMTPATVTVWMCSIFGFGTRGLVQSISVQMHEELVLYWS